MQNMNGKTALGLDTGIGVLICYFGNLACGLPLGLIYSILVIVQDKTNKVARFHAFQVLFLQVAGIVISIPIAILVFVAMFLDTAILGFPSLFTGVLGLVALGLSIGILYFVIMAAIKGYGGEIYKIPVVGNFAEKYSN
ncbi:MAG: hypothetical protein ACR2MG_15925 [Pyrinomonadaceae bacterium]